MTCVATDPTKFLVCLEAIAFGVDLCFTADVFIFLFQHEISELHQPIGVKFCTVVSNR